MLQQTTVKTVEPYYVAFLLRFPTLEALARAPVEKVLAAWSGLGYYRRARHLHAAARVVAAEHGGRIPATREELLALPGIGRYTAGAILSIAFGRPEPIVDGNVARVVSRLLLLRGDPRGRTAQQRLWGAARALVEASPSPADLNQSLMELGATVCSTSAPACRRCPIARSCAARAAGLQETIPPVRRQRAPVRLQQTIAIVRRNGRLLMHRRARTGLLDGLWEFPEVPGAPRPGGLRLRLGRRLGSVRHTITFRRFEVEVRAARLVAPPRGRSYTWVSPATARRLPTSSLVGKILATLEG